MGSVAERLAAHLSERGGERIADVRMGLGYTAVRLESGATGLAYTLRDALRGGCTVYRGPRPVAGRPAAEVLPLLGSSDVLEAALGLATANALAALEPSGAREGDVLEALELLPTDEVAMIGHFDPLAKALRPRVRALRIFERAGGGEGVLPAEAAADWLPRSNVALVTSTSLLNGTLDGLLAAARNCREVALVGPSTPLVPAAFAGTSVSRLSGVEVADPEGLLRVVSEGGGMQFFRGLVRKVVLPTRPPESTA